MSFLVLYFDSFEIALKRRDKNFMSEITGKQIAQTAKQMFGTDQITQEQLAYVMDMLRPSSYLLRNHTIKNHPITFAIQNRDMEKALSHRPWQVGR